MTEPMPAERLEEIEVGSQIYYRFPERKAIQELLAEVKRCWARIDQQSEEGLSRVQRHSDRLAHIREIIIGADGMNWRGCLTQIQYLAREGQG